MPKVSKSQESEQDPFMDVELPENAKEIVGDVDGYWDEDKSAIRFQPLSAKMFDNNNDETRASVLILGKLTAPVMLYNKVENSDERDYRVFPAGSAVGVWYKPGMRQIVKRCGVDCYLKLTGEKKTGKPNPMKVFQLVAGDETHRIPVTEDFRDKSKNFNTPFDPKSVKSDTNGDVEEDFDL